MTKKHKRIERIDLSDYRAVDPATGKIVTGVLVEYYREGWRAHTSPAPGDVKLIHGANLADKISELREWCEVNGATWDIVEWPTGSRAFLGARKPVRNRAAILRMREEFPRRYANYKRFEGVQWHAVDFAVMF